MPLLAVNFHYVRPRFDAPFAGIHGLTPGAFEAQLVALSEVGTFVSGARVGDAIEGRAPLPERAILVTFDDGLAEQVAHALPVLERLGVPALFFVNTACIDGQHLSAVHRIHLLRAHTDPDTLWRALARAAAKDGVELSTASIPDAVARRQYPYDRPEDARLKFLLNVASAPEDVERWVKRVYPELGRDAETDAKALYMSADDVRRLAARGYLGSHAHHHKALSALGPEALEDEIATSFRRLRALAPDARIDTFSYPYGGKRACPPGAEAPLRAAGARFALTTERAVNADLEAPFFLARFAANDVPGGTSPLFSAERFFASAPRRAWFRRAEALS